MSFKLLLLQLGFTCSTAADKLLFILLDSQCLRAFFWAALTAESRNFLTYMKNIHFLSSLEPMKLHGEIQRHAIVTTYMFMTNDRCDNSFV